MATQPLLRPQQLLYSQRHIFNHSLRHALREMKAKI
jgi:hypothetical protein